MALAGSVLAMRRYCFEKDWLTEPVPQLDGNPVVDALGRWREIRQNSRQTRLQNQAVGVERCLREREAQCR